MENNNNNNNNTTPSKKTIAKYLLIQYLLYTADVNVHQAPTTGVNSGAEGRAFERAVNYELGLIKRSLVVQGANRIDSVKYITLDGKKKRINIEIKTGCGTLAVLNSDGTIASSPLLNSDFIVYTPQFYPALAVRDQALVFEVDAFMDILERHGLIRKKVSGKMNSIKKDGGEWYYDIMAIQSFKNSKKKFHAFTSDLFFEGMLLDDFIEQYNVSI